MSNKSRLQTNNTNLQALINKANALPEAGGGGSGGMETCTVTATQPGGPTPVIPYIVYTNSNMEIVSEDLTDALTLTVVKGTILLGIDGSSMDNVVSGDASIIHHYGTQTSFQINGNATIEIVPM